MQLAILSLIWFLSIINIVLQNHKIPIYAQYTTVTRHQTGIPGKLKFVTNIYVFNLISSTQNVDCPSNVSIIMPRYFYLLSCGILWCEIVHQIDILNIPEKGLGPNKLNQEKLNSFFLQLWIHLPVIMLYIRQLTYNFLLSINWLQTFVSLMWSWGIKNAICYSKCRMIMPI